MYANLPSLRPYNPLEKSSTLLWLAETLETIPPTLQRLTLKIFVDTRLFNFVSGSRNGNRTGAITTDRESEWQVLGERLRLLRLGSFMRNAVQVDVDLDADIHRFECESGLVCEGHGDGL